uniref:SERPIN domain-containing protein n=1 Tax=Brugia timori TaxID=42155 RepID=A0A0R3QHN1_9BILA
LVSGLHPATDRPIRTRFLYGFPIRLTLPLNFTRFASHDYVFIMRYLSVGFPIRKSPDQS